MRTKLKQRSPGNRKRTARRRHSGKKGGKAEMEAIEWIKFLAGALLLLLGTTIFIFEMIGVFRFKYVLNRMHAAAMGDTLGIGACILGLIIMNGMNLTSLKLFVVIIFLWFSSPVSSHLIARLEVTTDEEQDKHYRRLILSQVEESCERNNCEEKNRKQESREQNNCEEKCRVQAAEKEEVK